jgi:hypothetical protein
MSPSFNRNCRILNIIYFEHKKRWKAFGFLNEFEKRFAWRFGYQKCFMITRSCQSQVELLRLVMSIETRDEGEQSSCHVPHIRPY